MMRERSAAQPGIVHQLQEETIKFAKLCQSYARQMGGGRTNKELKKLRQGVSRNRAVLKALAQKAEACEGAYQSVVAACRAIALGELEVNRGG